MSIFGPSLDSSDVEAAVIAHLEAWMPTTIAEIRRQKDPKGERWPKGVAPVRSYDVSHAAAAADKWPESALPIIIAQSPGMDEDPFVDGEGKVRAIYGIIVTAIASGNTMENSKALGRLYAAAARMAILQEPALAAGTETPFALGVRMGAERNVPVRRGVDAERNLMAVSIPFMVEVAGILDTQGGPLKPQSAEELETDEPPEEWPTVAEGGGEIDAIEQGEDAVEKLREGGFFT